MARPGKKLTRDDLKAAAYAGVLDHRGIRSADDMVTMPLQCGTQWDGPGHVFFEDHMWHGDGRALGHQRCDFAPALEKALESGRPAIVDVASDIDAMAPRATV